MKQRFYTGNIEYIEDRLQDIDPIIVTDKSKHIFTDVLVDNKVMLVDMESGFKFPHISTVIDPSHPYVTNLKEINMHFTSIGDLRLYKEFINNLPNQKEEKSISLKMILDNQRFISNKEHR